MIDYDKLKTAKPANKQAAIVTSKSEEYIPDKKVVVLEWDSPPPLRAPPLEVRHLIGKKVGRLTVIGLSEKRGVWVCRCACGKYVSRKAKSIGNPNNDKDRCEQCRHVRYLKHQGQRLSNNKSNP